MKKLVKYINNKCNFALIHTNDLYPTQDHLVRLKNIFK